jgi:transglutaminase-like putative cysteine protease
LALVLLLALVPALLPRAQLRLAASVPALLLAGAVAFDDSPWAFIDGARTGLRSFYDVALPFDPAVHPEMHGLVLFAVFAFALAVSLAVAERRAISAVGAFAAGAGWPATLIPGEAALGQGVLILAGALVLLAAVRPRPVTRPGRVAVAGGAVAAAALIASTIPAIARDQIVGWETWDPYARPDPSVGVQYVWDSSYTGVDFPDDATELLEIAAPRDPRYWRATTLDLYRNGRWFENLAATSPIERAGRVELISDSDLPQAARQPSRWVEQQVRVTGLRDTHLVGASVPTAYDVDEDEDVDFSAGGIAEIDGGMRRGFRYSVWSYSASPSPRELAATPPDYDPEVSATYLEVDRDLYVPAFGVPGRHARVLELIRNEPELGQYEQLYRIARSVAGAATPYGAVVKLETWLRTNPQFVYEEQPPRWPAGVPPLVDFVVRTRQGYCQQYAGAMALMLRYLGIPARVGAGFTSGRYDADGGTWTVTDRNAHTWVEVWFRGFGWLPFDPTPGRGLLTGPYTSASLGFRGREALEALGREQGLGVDGRRAIEAQLSRRLARERALDRALRLSDDPGSRDGRGDVTLVILLLVAIAGTGMIAAAKVVRRRVRYLRGDPRRIAGACRLELMDFVRDQRVDVRPAATLEEVGERVRAALAVNTRRFVAAAEAARFGPGGARRLGGRGGVDGAARARPSQACNPREPVEAQPHARARLAPLAARLVTWRRSSSRPAKGGACGRSPNTGRSRCCRSTAGPWWRRSSRSSTVVGSVPSRS